MDVDKPITVWYHSYGGEKMIYQNILKDSSPYFAKTGVLNNFGEHRHGDIEINYCIEGDFDVLIDKKKYTVRENQFSLIAPMRSHEYQNESNVKRKVLTIIVGISFLKRYFTKFSKIPFDSPVFELDEAHPTHKKLIELFFPPIGQTQTSPWEFRERIHFVPCYFSPILILGSMNP